MDGIINVNKPAGITSHAVAARLRRLLNERKVGHTGTLDPSASGVLPILVGKATKISDFIMAGEKAYRAEIVFGKTTDTDDLDGEVLSEDTKVSVSKEAFLKVLKDFVGPMTQIPPMYSAVKQNGKKLYELARQGIEVERTPRKIEIYSLTLCKFSGNRAVFDVSCSKGTYIRTLCRDMGEALGVGACMGMLIRTRSGRFAIEDAFTLEDIEQALEKDKVSDFLLPLSEALSDYPVIRVADEDQKKVVNGGKLSLRYVNREADYYRIENEIGELLALYEPFLKDGKLTGLKLNKAFF